MYFCGDFVDYSLYGPLTVCFIWCQEISKLICHDNDLKSK